MEVKDLDYDQIAEGIFAPIYPDIARAMTERTGKTGGRLLDIGCGGGHMGFAVMARGDFTGTFCDIRPEAVRLTAARAEKLGLASRVTAVQGDVHALPFPDESFDLIVSRGSMPFWDDQKKAFRELYRLLAENGRAYVGGGLGGAAHQARIRAQLQTDNPGFRCFDRAHSKSLKTEEYAALLDELGAVHREIDSPDEGRWFLFGKGGSL